MSKLCMIFRFFYFFTVKIFPESESKFRFLSSESESRKNWLISGFNSNLDFHITDLWAPLDSKTSFTF